jgi:hypothetical protein
VVQEDTREVGLVAPMDLKVELVHTLHQSKPTHCLGGLLNLYTRISKEDNHWDNQGRREDSQVRDK